MMQENFSPINQTSIQLKERSVDFYAKAMAVKTRTPEVSVESVVTKETVDVVKTPTALDTFVEHQRKALDEATKAIKALIPNGVQTHSEAAVREVIEGYRQLFNTTLDELTEFIKKAKIEEKSAK
jgi:hypothetical protein